MAGARLLTVAMCVNVVSFATPPHDCAEAHQVLALVALHGNEVFASGSAVLVAPHLAFTARHVLDDFAERYQGIAAQTDGSANYAIIARGFYGERWRMFHILQTFNTAGTDISALNVTLAYDETADFPWPRVNLDLLPPRRRSCVVSWGYVSPQAFLAGTTQNELHWYATLVRSFGSVQEIFPQIRDRAVVDYPAFHFDARVDASMSGGPVFDEHGSLVGINTRSLPATGDDQMHTSTAALLWPVPALPFVTRGESYPTGVSVEFIEDLHQLGFVPILNHASVRVDRTVSPGELHVSVSIPEDRH